MTSKRLVFLNTSNKLLEEIYQSVSELYLKSYPVFYVSYSLLKNSHKALAKARAKHGENYMPPFLTLTKNIFMTDNYMPPDIADAFDKLICLIGEDAKHLKYLKSAARKGDFDARCALGIYYCPGFDLDFFKCKTIFIPDTSIQYFLLMGDYKNNIAKKLIKLLHPYLLDKEGQEIINKIETDMEKERIYMTIYFVSIVIIFTYIYTNSSP